MLVKRIEDMEQNRIENESIEWKMNQENFTEMLTISEKDIDLDWTPVKVRMLIK